MTSLRPRLGGVDHENRVLCRVIVQHSDDFFASVLSEVKDASARPLISSLRNGESKMENFRFYSCDMLLVFICQFQIISD